MAISETMRRIITEEKDGRSCALIDGAPASVLGEEQGDAVLAEIWSAALDPQSLLHGEDTLAGATPTLEPEPGSVKVRWFTVPPDDPSVSDADKDALAEFAFALAGASHARVDTSRHPMMHKTDTLDVIVCVKGAVTLLLDDGEARGLKPGDVVIQRATNHAWVNEGDETAILVAVLMNAG